MSRPKAVIFDLGGVLITSPLKAIEEYEDEYGIPRGYLNYAMFEPSRKFLTSRVSAQPNAWAELETGKLQTDETFYARWREDLSSSKAWSEFHRSKGLQEKGSPPQIDPEILLKQMIIPKEGGRLIPETFAALKKLKENGVTTCGLTNNFVSSH